MHTEIPTHSKLYQHERGPSLHSLHVFQSLYRLLIPFVIASDGLFCCRERTRTRKSLRKLHLTEMKQLTRRHIHWSEQRHIHHRDKYTQIGSAKRRHRRQNGNMHTTRKTYSFSDGHLSVTDCMKIAHIMREISAIESSSSHTKTTRHNVTHRATHCACTSQARECWYDHKFLLY